MVPIGTARLMAVLEWLRLDAEGGRKPDEMLVFSDEVGEAFKTFKRAWTLRPPSSVWRRARPSTRQPTSGTFFQVSFRDQPRQPSNGGQAPAH